MKALIIFNRPPYDSTDVTWNGLRLAEKLLDANQEVSIFKVCGTCMARCGIYKNQPYFEGAEKSTISALAEWVIDSDKVITF